MLKLVWKTLWVRRRRNGWLLAELTLVTIVSWIIFDPVIVSLYDRHLPLGYDAPRLAFVSFAERNPDAPGYDSQRQDSVSRMQTLASIMLRIRQHPDVKSATPLTEGGYPGAPHVAKQSFALPKDSLNTMWIVYRYVPRQQYFETMGYRPGKGRSLQELSDLYVGNYKYIFTEDLLRVGWGDDDPRGKKLYSVGQANDTTFIDIMGSIGPIKLKLDEKPRPAMFQSLPPEGVSWLARRGLKVAVRLKDDVSMDRFLHDFHPWMLENLRVGNLYANKVECYLTMLQDQAYATSTALFRRSLALSVFFLVNLCLGVAGTFWVQTRTRREEVGVHLSFGATPRRIRMMLLAEGAVLVTVAVAIGCLIYWNYAMMDGLAAGTTTDRYVGLYWTDDFALHFTIISLAVYAVLLAVTLFGVWMPARSISRVPPTEALRDE